MGLPDTQRDGGDRATRAPAPSLPVTHEQTQQFNLTTVAFKEWAAVVGALAGGQQSLILRKGGIHEGRAGFRVEHERFWLFPTHFHEQPSSFAPEFQSRVAPSVPAEHQVPTEQQVPAEQSLPIQHLAEVSAVWHLTDFRAVQSLRGWHVWSDRVVAERFAYRTPGLFALLVRVWSRAAPAWLANQTSYAGCRSWVPLSEPIPAAPLTPALTDSAAVLRAAQIQHALADVGAIQAPGAPNNC